MQCTNPLRGWRRAGAAHKADKPGITFNPREAAKDTEQYIACGQCAACRVNRSREWALRCLFESKEHDVNAFITLTYDEENLPEDGSLNHRHFQLFMKRLRKRTGRKLSYFVSGEYGKDSSQPTGLGRPHYHALIFGYQWPDLVEVGQSRTGEKRYISELLAKDWGFGSVEAGTVTQRSAGYVARYTMKKIGGELAADHYKKINFATGEIHTVKPEYSACSKRPGIGRRWYDKHKADLEKGYIVVNGTECPVPHYYKKLLNQEDSIRWQKAKREQQNQSDPRDEKFSWEQRLIREEKLKLKLKRLESKRL